MRKGAPLAGRASQAAVDHYPQAAALTAGRDREGGMYSAPVCIGNKSLCCAQESYAQLGAKPRT
jgi:hypothetical protein